MITRMIQRRIYTELLDAIDSNPAVALLGPRQVGKTTEGCWRSAVFLLMGGFIFAGQISISGQAVQTPGQPNAESSGQGSKLQFEVASIRLGDLYSNDKLDGTMNENPPRSDQFSASTFLWHYIEFAYHLPHSDQQDLSIYNSVTNAKLNTVKWDIEARTEGIPTQEQLRQMVQSLLEDRFKLRAHYETRQGPVYALVVDTPGKLGPQLHRQSEATPCVKVGSGEASAPSAENTSHYCGEVQGNVDQRYLMHVTMVAAPIDKLVDHLNLLGRGWGGLMGIPIVDQTGLKGEYDLQLSYAASPPFDRPDAQVPGPGSPTMQDALKKQLGLRLVMTKGPVKFLVIDHIGRPSAN
jgi:uncharacterized protein (TIGR03435 family)